MKFSKLNKNLPEFKAAEFTMGVSGKYVAEASDLAIPAGTVVNHFDLVMYDGSVTMLHLKDTLRSSVNDEDISGWVYENTLKTVTALIFND